MRSGVEGLDLSHEGVRRVVGLLKGFVYAIASAPREFLYLSYLKINENMIQKRKEKKKKRPLHLSYLPTYERSTFVLTLRPHVRPLEI